MVHQEGMEWCWLIKKPCLIKKAFVWLIKKALLHHYSHDKYADGKASASSSNWHREVEVILMRYQISTLKWKGSRECREHNMERGGNTQSSTSITVMQKCTFEKFHNKTPNKSLSTQNQTQDLCQQITCTLYKCSPFQNISQQNSPQVSWPGIEPRTDRLTRHSTVCRSTNWAIKRGINVYPRWGSNPRPWVY